MRNLGAVEAANEIRSDVFNMPGLDPEQQHQIRFVQSVCSQLGLEPSPDNMQKVSVVLHKHDIGLHVGHEFPKFATRGHDGARKVVQDEHEQSDWENEAPPEPVAAPGPVVSEVPPHQQNLDLTKQVPGPPETMEHPAGRAPDTATNHAAAQNQEEETFGHAHGEADVSDDDVHVEEVDDKPEPEPEPSKPRRPVGTRRPM